MTAMTSWFGSRPWGPRKGPAPGDDKLEAYREGRQDERTKEPAAKARRGEIDDAYSRGRRDERRRRRGSPLLSLILLIIVVAAGALFYLAIHNGSFASGGAAVDNSISTVSQSATAPVRRAADKAGNALENAGQTLKQKAGDQAAPPPGQ
ncbi:MAG TPA: hypothetical protein VG166_01120 [Caulobacteraceae bacterium]|nr:hypothetical protein [Caulobacteraceae bacterium]